MNKTQLVSFFVYSILEYLLSNGTTEINNTTSYLDLNK